MIQWSVAALAGAGYGTAEITSASPAPAPPTVRVPLFHGEPSSPILEIDYEWGAPFRPSLPTVMLVADAQQFYVRPGAAADLQTKLFGPDVNVLGLFGRARSRQLLDFVRPNGAVDWGRAAKTLNIHQWIGDIRITADRLSIPADKLALYGRSGGADLTLRFLATHPQRAGKAYVQAAVTHDLAARWGVTADRFWEELRGRSPDLATRLAEFVTANSDRRREAILLLQRQNFYETLEALPGARAKLIEAILRQDRAAISDYRKRYQLDTLEAIRSAGTDLSAVRLHEFSRAYPDPRGRPAPLRPDIESIFHYAEPVERELYDAQVRRPPPGLDGLRKTSAELLILAGRHDHTADYRTQIGLSALAPRSELLLLDDDHVFKRLTASGRHPVLFQAFFRSGLGSAEFREAVSALGSLRWNENS